MFSPWMGSHSLAMMILLVNASKMYGNDDLKIITLSSRSTHRVSHKLLRRTFPFKTASST